MLDPSKEIDEGQRPRLAVFKFASCDGCQLSMLNLEEDLLALGQALDIAYFPEASSDMSDGPYDIALVEGSITTAEDAQRILNVRQQTKKLLTIGACATAGGIQALRNWGDIEAFKQAVYPRPDYIQSLSTSTPISDHVRVDFELWGCPIDKGQLLRVLTDLSAGVPPRLPVDSVCLECKRRGTVCVVVAKGMPCLGPVTRSGCGAICPAMGRDCYGCFGPSEGARKGPGLPPNTSSLAKHFHEELQLIPIEVLRRFRGINGDASPFRDESNVWEKKA
ncbi:NADH-quinone oxidoreductase subunit B family protein [Candidatus Nitrospira nitrificans]|uniref:Sulfhydrogenase, subunit delta n=1 Tax=Candidatus Nitrospira nitrificans TaxID=1742973 RepID=A0A0S4LBS3_9BACT|nr:sulfhydrogenase subunit delta [Candidatus Nitrospira nitrificans]CUS35143.1 Sulfhydrogenase, subunit delta [Candidatus Nitrospira nitrificans]